MDNTITLIGGMDHTGEGLTLNYALQESWNCLYDQLT